MDNATRSERSRNAVIQAALAIIARDGPARLTLDAIARESGISKGGLMHQFRSKEAVLKAVLEQQIEHFEAISRDYEAKFAGNHPAPHLAAQIATSREAAVGSHVAALAAYGALADQPDLLSASRKLDVDKVQAIKAEADDPDLALLRWTAARGLAITAVLGLCPFSDAERARLFDRLLDNHAWTRPATAAKPVAAGKAPKSR
ncbi:MAG: TetR family transcriptional regulator [Alphaproteobacteria bacterium]|jgi:AcrR family transcriptional regulator|nr:TetR family transcriptional regulator [Alphaproteobacteria bacterium]